MKRTYVIPFAILVFCILVFLLFPRRVEHGILTESNSKKSTFYVKGKLKEFRCSQLSFEKNTVLDFRYNCFSAFSFEKIPELEERIMVKSDNSFELEKQGIINLSNQSFYYQLDRENNLIPSSAKKIIVGKNNVKSYVDRRGKLKTFIITPMDFSTMRVAISTTNFSSLYHESLQLKSSSSIQVFSMRENFNKSFPQNTILDLKFSEGKLHIASGDSTIIFNQRVYIKGTNIFINTISRGSPSFTPSYNGVLELIPSSKGILVINEVNLEDYLSKVVPSEMPASSALESLKCQAIAARTYAISDMLANRYASLGFHVDDSTQSQVYNNMPPQNSSTEAVNLTKGAILTSDNEPIDAKYYSSSAGTGVRYEDIWFKSDFSSEHKPYLTTENYITSKIKLPSNEKEWLEFYKNKDLKAIDSTSPYFRWYVEFPQAVLTQSLNKSLKVVYERYRDFIKIKKGEKVIDEFPELKNLKDITVLRRSEGGNIILLSFSFENVTVEVAGDYYIRSSIRCSTEYNGTPISIIRHKGSPITNSNFLPSSFFSVEKNGDKFIVYGGGYGHGVGMSQYGAMELGKGGMDYKSILNMFYKGAVLEKLY